MKYFSTNDLQVSDSFKTAIFQGLPADNGLYMPTSIPKLDPSFFTKLPKLSLAEIALEVLAPYTESEIDQNDLAAMCEDVFQFEIPLIPLDRNLYSLELFHGPTLAFKDVGARFLARALSYFTKKTGEELTILVATSGDTGSAVAHGFFNVPNIHVKVLFPKGKISRLQQQQMTTMGNNIEALAIEGVFDDCQALVKQAFLDQDLRSKLNITSANSINMARLLPQSIYYFYVWGQLQEEQRSSTIFSVPSGNYGNLSAGLIAHKMGLPIHKFLAASNSNKIVPEYLRTGSFEPAHSVKTISNAMDVGNPSNFARMKSLYPSHDSMTSMISGFHYSDEETRRYMKMALEEYNYTCDPHGAIGFAALKESGLKPNQTGIFLETAHPSKFKDVVEETLGNVVQIPERLKSTLDRESVYKSISKDYSSFKEILLS